MIEIVSANTTVLLNEAITLSQEYVEWMVATIRVHYPELDLAEFTSEHDYDDVRRKFPGEHVRPYGRLLIALSDDKVGGCIALGKLSDTVCEMRTLYVRPTFRGSGLGRKLVHTLLDEACTVGYTHMRLDPLDFMHNALNLYRGLGFYEIAPYRNVSTSLRQYICFLELRLRDQETRLES
jgi:GNAT superfamily N-acetyltransferase